MLKAHSISQLGSQWAAHAGYVAAQFLETDYNGDGFLELAAVAGLTDSIDVLIGIGDGSFEPGDLIPVSAFSQSINTGDFNGDGVLDLVSTDRSIDTVTVLLHQSTHGIAPLLELSLLTTADARHEASVDASGILTEADESELQSLVGKPFTFVVKGSGC